MYCTMPGFMLGSAELDHELNLSYLADLHLARSCPGAVMRPINSQPVNPNSQSVRNCRRTSSSPLLGGVDLL
jgi:hypothetical protein